MTAACRNCSACFLCSNLSERGGAIYEDDLIRILADLSPLEAGHILICSKEHVNSFKSAIQRTGSAVPIQAALSELTRITGKQYLCFEHGTSENDLGLGCIAHAHIHCVPMDDNTPSATSLMTNFAELTGQQSKSAFSRFYDLHELEDNSGYAWVYDTVSKQHRWLQIETSSVQQLTRRAYLQSSNRPFADYRDCRNFVAANELGSAIQAKFSGRLKPSNAMLIEGLSGSGKTSLALRLAQQTNGRHIASGLYYCAAALDASHCTEACEGNARWSKLRPIVEVAATEQIRLLAADFASKKANWQSVAKKVRIVSDFTRSFDVPTIIEGRGFSHTFFSDASPKIYLQSDDSTRTRNVKNRSSQSSQKHSITHQNAQFLRDQTDLARMHGQSIPAEDCVILKCDQKSIGEIASEVMKLLNEPAAIADAHV